MNLVKFSLRHPAVAIVITAVLVTVGLYSFLKMPRSEDPSITIRTGLVIAQYPGATSEQVEQQVTKVIEKHIFKFPEVNREKTYSTSRPGLAFVNVELEDYVKNAELFWAKLRNEMIEARSEFPEGVRGPIINSNFGDTIAMLAAVNGKRNRYRELHEYTERIQDELRTLKDVGRMERYGEQSEQILITTSMERMSQYMIDPIRVMQALQQRNVIGGAGSLDTEQAKIPLRTTGLFRTEDQIGTLLLDVSKNGQAVHLRDFARIERRYQDPVFLTRYDGEPSVLLSVEMQKGKNMVELGDHIAGLKARVKSILPPDLSIGLICNQPEVVKARVTRLSHEFMLAIGSVILVTMLLLPLRVAVIAAVAIPVTICTTLGLMNALGIEIHQCSVAALIVVLGIVVDDAIVIADNYLELLDRKVKREEAAWRSAMDVIVPVFSATVTIVCSFLPLLVLTGGMGEYIVSLPLTVSIALTVSFIVAVMLTPILCRFFIKKGLYEHRQSQKEKGKEKFNVLEALRNSYHKSIIYFMKRKGLAISIGLGAVCLGVFLMKFVPQEFFPSAERNQFVIDVWARQGTRIESTDAMMRRIEQHLSKRPDVVHYASFVGQGTPRFFYSVTPQQPDGAYGQMIITTTSHEITPLLVSELGSDLAKLVPEAMIVVKELQQGQPFEAPIEIRISGEDLNELKRLGSEVQKIVSAVPYSLYVHSDWFNDSFMVDINVQNELSNRLGLTSASISQAMFGGFDGAPVSTFWEGDRPVTMFFRLEPDSRSSFADVANTYVTSPLTHARVPLRSVANLKPEWQTSRIVHRNGVRTLTVQSFAKKGYFASSLLKTVEPKIKALQLPPGYRITYGGERFNRDRNMPEMMKSLYISLVAIFLVILIQFRTVSDTLIVMSSIPLMVLGGVVGLLITGNSFGFMAFIGFSSLTGMVVRNAIILLDFIHDNIAKGHTLEEAATEAGRRRLRPIFLTTMAAAVGVTPMMFSGSSMWSPLASVIAVGLIFSMFFTLLVVPVLFVMVHSRKHAPTPKTIVGIVVAAGIFLGSGSFGPSMIGPARAWAETKQITLSEAVDLALANNSSIKIAQARVRENREKVNATRADYYPHLTNSSNFMNITNRQLVTFPAGSLGTVPGLGPFPTQETHIEQGSSSVLISNTTLSQPLTQLLKINQADHIASAEQGMAEADFRKAETEIVYAVRRLYYGLLIAKRQKEASQASIAAAEENLRESEKGLESGNLLEVAVTGSRVVLLQGKQNLLSAEIQISDINVELDDLMGLPLDTLLEPVETPSTDSRVRSREEYFKDALSRNPEIEAARKNVKKAASAVKAAKYEYIPDLGIYGSYIFQDGVPFVDQNIGMLGVQMSWNIFDWGKRKAVVGQRRMQFDQARENLNRIEKRVTVEIDKAYRKLEQTRMIIEVAREAVVLQKEKVRLSENGVKAGTVKTAQHAEAIAAMKRAQSDETQALLGFELALADLDRLSGGQVKR
jgi:multidrug efflux pump subunit AcrB/outer membrane protein TolC